MLQFKITVLYFNIFYIISFINIFIKKTLYFSLFIPSLSSLYWFEQCLNLGITSTSCDCLPL